ncbi:hypothetical protein BG015_000792 [Linnemannia schmuckeri]|uniref:Uncharacterized protein n=1 Tax=Linnemannia schmuckeri TaxID=64567 RepID=A0A9P5RU59_9FUNG|nr:hypothetical protein BG015_000792 [Linnemannia schmuckeri]
MYTSGSIDSFVRMLLARHSSDIGPLPKGISVPYEFDILTISNNSSLDYTAHIHHLRQWTIASLAHLKWEHPNPALQSYVLQEDLQRTYCFNPFYRPINRDFVRVQATTSYFRMAHSREVNWILMSPILKQLQTLTVPVLDTRRYISVIDRLRDLENVLFVLDELFVYGPANSPSNNGYSQTDVEEILRTTKAREEATMQDLFLFVKEHNRRFNNQLRTVECPESYMWTGIIQMCPETVQFELLKTLQMFRSPLSINHVNQINLSPMWRRSILWTFGRSALLIIQDSCMINSAAIETFSGSVIHSGRSGCRPLDLSTAHPLDDKIQGSHPNLAVANFRRERFISVDRVQHKRTFWLQRPYMWTSVQGFVSSLVQDFSPTVPE